MMSSANNLMYLVETCSLNKKEPLSGRLSTAKITRTEKYGALIYPVEFFYLFVRSIEFVFSKLLITKNISICGDGLVGKIIDCINKNSTLIFILTNFLPVEPREKVSEVTELRTFLFSLCGEFRGKKVVRVFMKSSKHSLQLGIR